MLAMRDPSHVSPGGRRSRIELDPVQKEHLADLFDEQISIGSEGSEGYAESRAKAAFRKQHRVRDGVFVLRRGVSYSTPIQEAAADAGVDPDDRAAVLKWEGEQAPGSETAPREKTTTEEPGMAPAAGMSEDALKTARLLRSGRFGVDPLEKGGNLSYPDGGPTELDAYADPVNLRMPFQTKETLEAALESFVAARSDYGTRSQKVVYSRMVAQALKSGLEVSQEDALFAVLAPDLQRRVKAQVVQGSEGGEGGKGPGGHNPDGSGPLPGGRGNGPGDGQEDGSGLPKPKKKGDEHPAVSFKLDLDGGSIMELQGLLDSTVRGAAKAGLFGEVQDPDRDYDHGYQHMYLVCVEEKTLIVHNYYSEPSKDFRASWIKNADGTVTLSNVREVKSVQQYVDVGPGPSEGTYTTGQDGSSVVSDALSEAVDTAVAVARDLSLSPAVKAALKAAGEAVSSLSAEKVRVTAVKNDDGSYQRFIPISKIDAPQRTVWLEVYVPNERDTQGDWMTAKTIWDAQVFFMQHAQRIDATHDFVERKVSVVECFQARGGDIDFIKGAWVLGLKVEDDELWTSIEKEEYRMVSLAGLAIEDPDSSPPGEPF